MKIFLLDLIPQIQRYSMKLDNTTLLTSHQWFLIDKQNNAKTVYIFRKKGELLLSKNGNVTKGHWEYLGNNTLLIDAGDTSYLYKHGFFDENILAMKIDGVQEYSIFVNQMLYDNQVNSIEKISIFLNRKYLKNSTSDEKGDTSAEIASSEGKVIREFNSWSFSTGKYTEYQIEFGNTTGKILYFSKENKYCFSKVDKVEYFDECVNEYKKYLSL